MIGRQAHKHTSTRQIVRTVRLWKFATDCQWKFNVKRPKTDALLGKWLKDEMIELGPAFMKMGQFMSTRSDVFGTEITRELSYLQDDANAVDFSYIQPIIEAELGFPIDTAFSHFEKEPIASASIGQVHKAQMRIKGGSSIDVVVKVQKPGVRAQIQEDLSILKTLSSLAALSGTQRGREAQQLLLQYETFLKAELDYKNEVDNMIEFRVKAREPQLIDSPTVLIPRPFPTLCTQNVLVMEYMPSIKVTDIASLTNAGISPNAVGTAIVNAFISQIVIYGVVHCDPHPGNIGVVPTKSGATGAFSIVLYDFGNVVHLSETFRGEINNLVLAVVQEDVDEFLELLLALNVIRINDPLEKLELRSFFSYFFQYLKTVDFTKLRTSIVENEALQQSQIGFKVDNDFLALFRVFSLLDGTCIYLNPQFSYIDALGPFSQAIMADTKFFETRIRRDIGLLVSNFGKSKPADDKIILALNSRIRDVGDRTNMFRGMFMALAVLDGIEDPARLFIVLPAIAWFVLEKK